MDAARLIDEYGSLDKKEQKEFDRRYKDLMLFRRNLQTIVKTVVSTSKRRKGGRKVIGAALKAFEKGGDE